MKSFFIGRAIGLATARAGNVIGGGDYTATRLLPDCFHAVENNLSLKIRNPNAIRPWQHVLEPLRGYIELATNLYKSKKLNGNSFNFGPKQNFKFKKVIDVIKIIKLFWPSFNWKYKINKKIVESKLLSLNSNKAKKFLKWETILSSEESIILTLNWYDKFYKKNNEDKITISQIEEYEKKIKNKKNKNK